MALHLFKIADITVENPTTTVTFNNIPQGYSDLKLVSSSRNSSNTPEETITFNGSSTGFTDRVLYFYDTVGAGSNSSTLPRSTSSMSNQTANSFSNSECYIPNYSLVINKNFSIDSVSPNNGVANAFIYITAGLWANTAAITSLTVTSAASGFFVANSTFTLYGVL
jgi:hypothetical protein